MTGWPRDEVQRVVLTCLGLCHAREGEYRIDLVLVPWCMTKRPPQRAFFAPG